MELPVARDPSCLDPDPNMATPSSQPDWQSARPQQDRRDGGWCWLRPPGLQQKGKVSFACSAYQFWIGGAGLERRVPIDGTQSSTCI